MFGFCINARSGRVEMKKIERESESYRGVISLVDRIENKKEVGLKTYAYIIAKSLERNCAIALLIRHVIEEDGHQ